MEYQTILFKGYKIYKKKIEQIDLIKVSEEFFVDFDFYVKYRSSDMVMKPNIRRMNEICFDELKSIY